MRTEADACPLTVWVGSARYVFQPGRDVLAGYGNRWDIPLDPPTPSPHPAVVLRFAGSHWVAIDGGHSGMFVGGARLSQVDIRDGQAITVGDPQRGPRLTFNLGTPASPPVPSEHGTRQMILPTAPVTPPPRPPTVPAAATGQATTEPSTTSRLPLKSGARTTGVSAYRLEDALLADVSFTARPASLTAVVGPSAARSSALLDLLSGARQPRSGKVTVDGHDVYAEPHAMRSRIGIVPREDRGYPSLSVERALGYAAELRLPPNTTPSHRERVVNQVLDELGLAPHRATRIGKLPPELRRCASMATELVTRPSLLVVDEPGSGLNAEQEKHVMAMLRRQANLGCAVVFGTTSATYLSICDQVLLLTSAGETAFVGSPAEIEPALGGSDWTKVLVRVNADPQGSHQAFVARQVSVPAAPHRLGPEPPPAELTLGQQIRFVVRRQLGLLTADWVYLLVLTLLPFALAGLTLLIPGSSGLDRPSSPAGNPHEAVEILAALNFAAVLMGTALTVGDLVRDRCVFRREQSVGLSASAYLAAKLLVFGALAAIQAAILTTVVLAVKGGPAHGAVLLDPKVELYLSVAATGIVSAIVGLALSSLGRSLREVLPLALPLVLASLLFAGGLVSLVGTWGYDQLSWFVPAQWGFAASASTVDLHRVDPLAANALLWTHYSGWWLFDMIVLAIFGVLWAGFVLYRLRSPAGLATSRAARTA